MTDEDPDGFDLLPEKKLIVGLIPGVGGPIATYLQERRDRQVKRAEQFQQVLLHEAEISPENLLEVISRDERLEELFWFAMEGATRTSLERKRVAFGRILAQGIMDKAEIDETELLLRALLAIDGPEIAMMNAIAEDEKGQGDKYVGSLVDGLYTPFGGQFQEIEAPVLERLKNELIIWDEDIRIPKYEGKDRGVGLTVFGKTLLKWLKENPNTEQSENDPTD